MKYLGGKLAKHLFIPVEFSTFELCILINPGKTAYIANKPRSVDHKKKR